MVKESVPESKILLLSKIFILKLNHILSSVVDTEQSEKTAYSEL